MFAENGSDFPEEHFELFLDSLDLCTLGLAVGVFLIVVAASFYLGSGDVVADWTLGIVRLP
jgi:hypothetical protein